jgi:peroxiredoxin
LKNNKLVFYFWISILFVATASAQKIRDFHLEDIQGEIKSFAEIKGEQLTIIDFWASWCKPCLKAIPELDKLFKKYHSQGVEIIGVSTDGPRSISNVAPLVRTMAISYPVLTDIDNAIVNEMEVAQIPTVIIINRDGEIAYRHEVYSKGDEIEIEGQITTLLSKP